MNISQIQKPTPPSYAEMNRRFEKAATLENAADWYVEMEGWIFCEALLDLSSALDGDRFVTRWITRLEDRFDLLLLEIDSENTTDGGDQWSLVAEASTLRFPVNVGAWPVSIRTGLGNGLDFHARSALMRDGEIVSRVYRQINGLLELTVFND